uniref:Vacuolar protein sorting-associated protein 51 homolog n=1 Tax=Panthera tigris altaica TaxID=74533 RepID=A0A8C9JEE8_PANTA
MAAAARWYGPSEGEAAGRPSGSDPLDPTDLNGAHFDPEVYLDKLRRECPLAQLMDSETDMVRQIRALDSDMQTLVYENYNKFISATDTIRKMKNDFRKMEDEMDRLATNMAVITDFSARISATLQDRHERHNKLAGTTRRWGGGEGSEGICRQGPQCWLCPLCTPAPPSPRGELLLGTGMRDQAVPWRGARACSLLAPARKRGPAVYLRPSSSQGEFCSQGVREGLIVGFIRSMCQTAQSFCDSPGEKGGATPPALLLLLSRLCLDYPGNPGAAHPVLTAPLSSASPAQDQSPVTPVSTLCAEARETARRLLTHYVKVQGLVISQMLRKSVETRDWLSTLEPRNVRAVMKRVVEDTTAIDVQVGLLYEEGVRKAQSSDSSKRTFSVYSSSRQQGRYAPSYTPSAPMDTNLLSNIQKLFSERIDVFSPVEFNKVSVLTGIIKISLKTLLECVRLRTFGRFGLQQVQVDCHFLQLYLWRFVADEELVHLLLDEVVASAALRCPDPVPMEPSVVEVICERG